MTHHFYHLLKRSATLLFLKAIVVDSFVALSRHSTQLSFASLYDDRSGKLITTGVQFRAEYHDITMAGNSDTDCYVAVGDARGFDRILYESPQMCLAFSVVPAEDGIQSASSSNLPQAVVAGMQGNQAMIAGFNYYGDYTAAFMVDPFNMPYGTFPVGLSTDALGGAYVALHDTNGLIPPASPEDATELLGVYEYVRKMRDPKLAAGRNPLVTKVNVTNGQVLWETQLETEGGHSTVGDIRYMSARDLLIVVGSSNGQGATVGGGGSSQDWDAYVTLFNTYTGNMDGSVANGTQLAVEPSKRIASQTGKDDFGTGLCITDDQIFVLGSTTGTIDGEQDGGGFVIALDADTLEILWKQQLVGQGVATVKCVVSGGLLYVAGHVPAGVVVADTTRSPEEPSDTQDLLISLLSSETGEVQWIRQIDSRRDDAVNDLFFGDLGDIMVTGNAMDFANDRNEIYNMLIKQKDGFYDWQELPRSVDPIVIYSTSTLTNGDADGNDKVSVVVPAVVASVLCLSLIALVQS